MSGFISSALQGMNLDNWLAIPMKRRISETLLGGCMSRIAFVCAGSTFTP